MSRQNRKKKTRWKTKENDKKEGRRKIKISTENLLVRLLFLHDRDKHIDQICHSIDSLVCQSSLQVSLTSQTKPRNKDFTFQEI